MTRKRALALAGVLFIVPWLAFVMRDVIRSVIIVPLAYLWWALNMLYSLLPQVAIWGGLVALAVFLFLGSLTSWGRPPDFIKIKTAVSQDSVESLAATISKTRGGIYIKWTVANRLGKIARDLLIQRGDRESRRKVGRLTGRDWQPSEPVSDYLEVGLNGSFADYPNRRWWLFSRPVPTPLDLDVEEAVAYLEEQMKTVEERI